MVQLVYFDSSIPAESMLENELTREVMCKRDIAYAIRTFSDKDFNTVDFYSGVKGVGVCSRLSFSGSSRNDVLDVLVLERPPFQSDTVRLTNA